MISFSFFNRINVPFNEMFSELKSVLLGYAGARSPALDPGHNAGCVRV